MSADSSKCIEFVEDRKGHDYRYSIDNSKYLANVGDKAKTSFEEGINKTLSFYKDKYSL